MMKRPTTEYWFAIAVVGLSTGVCFAIFRFLALINLVMIYLLGTLIVASRGSRRSAALSSVLSVLCFDFFFVPPRFTFSVADVQYVFTFIVMFSAAMIISHLTIRLRSEAQEAREGQETTAMVHEFSQLLSNARGLTDVLKVAVTRIAQTFSVDATALIPNHEDRLQINIRSADLGDINQKEQAVAQWVYDTGLPAGLGTDALPKADALFLPIPGAEKTLGILRVAPLDVHRPITSDRKKILDSFVRQVGMALDVDRLQENAKKNELEIETERLRSVLLSSVSHDFRTPLTAIVGSASTMLQKGDQLNQQQTKELLENIQSEGEHLSRLVQNLLQTTRLESGIVDLKKERYPLEEVLGSALGHLEKSFKERKINVHLPDDLPAIPMDCLLIEHVFINLLENAVRHTPKDGSISVSADLLDQQVIISVADEGPGIKESELKLIFEKFYRGQSSPGVGLGLAICKAIVKIHGGKIWVENRPVKGAVFKFWLPLSERYEQ